MLVRRTKNIGAQSKLRNCPGLEKVTAAFMAPRGKSIEEIIDLYSSDYAQVRKKEKKTYRAREIDLLQEIVNLYSSDSVQV